MTAVRPRAPRFGRHGIAAAVSLIALIGTATAEVPSFPPPKPGSAAVCLQKSVGPSLGIDWNIWDGQDPKRPRSELMLIAAEYASGSVRVAQNPETAGRILDYLDQTGGLGREGSVVKARILMDRLDLKSMDEAEDLLRKGIAKGAVSAARTLGDLLSNPRYGKVDVEAAVKAYRIAASQGDLQATLSLAQFVKSGAGGKASADLVDLAVTNAFVAVATAATAGDCRAARLMATLYTDGKLTPAKPELAFAWTRFAADRGEPAAAMMLGKAYHRGIGVKPDEEQAIRYFRLAADQGRASAFLPVGIALATGVGIERDLKAAVTYLEKAAKGGKLDAFYWLAQIYRGDFGGEGDPAKYYEYLVKAAEVPDPPADIWLDLGRATRDGFGTDKDVPGGLAYLIRAADAGSDDGALEAATLYATGADGVAPDPRRAERLYRLGVSNGSATAAVRLAEIYRCGAGVPRSAGKSRRFEERAAFLGSSASMRDMAERLLASADPGEQQRGNLLLRKAARGGDPAAIASLVIASRKAGDEATASRWTAHGHASEIRPGQFAVALARAERQSGRPVEAITDDLSTVAATGSEDAAVELGRLLAAAGRADDALPLLQAAAEQGLPAAMRQLSELLGPDNTAANRSGHDWLAAAAEAGDFSARLSLAEQLAPDDRIAALEKLSNEGLACNAENMAKLALAFSLAGAPASANRLAAIVETEVAKDDGPTLYTLGKLALTVPAPDRAEAWFKAAVAAGEMKALKPLVLSTASREPDRARALLVDRLSAGVSDAAKLYLRLAADETFAPVPADVDLALAKLGPLDMKTAGELLKLAKVVRESGDVVRARAWLESAANAGRTDAMSALADLLLYGSGAASDVSAGIGWLEKAAEAGDRQAKRALAAAYEVGFVVDLDANKARQLRAEADSPAPATP